MFPKVISLKNSFHSISIDESESTNHSVVSNSLRPQMVGIKCGLLYSSIICGSAGKEPTCNAGCTGDVGLIPVLGRSPRGRNANALKHSFLKNPTDRGV